MRCQFVCLNCLVQIVLLFLDPRTCVGFFRTWIPELNSLRCTSELEDLCVLLGGGGGLKDDAFIFHKKSRFFIPETNRRTFFAARTLLCRMFLKLVILATKRRTLVHWNTRTFKP